MAAEDDDDDDDEEGGDDGGVVVLPVSLNALAETTQTTDDGARFKQKLAALAAPTAPVETRAKAMDMTVNVAPARSAAAPPRMLI